jgi:hypothetical protein
MEPVPIFSLAVGAFTLKADLRPLHGAVMKGKTHGVFYSFVNTADPSVLAEGGITADDVSALLAMLAAGAT